MAREKLRDLLTSSDRGIGKTSGISGILSRLFRIMIRDLHITPTRWRVLMDDYVAAQMQHFSEEQNNKRDRASIRGNMNKEFLRSRMTWKTFCKAMMFFQIRRFKIIIIAEHENGRITEHSAVVEYATAAHKLPIEIEPPVMIDTEEREAKQE
jgi:hypothetical protein